MHICKNLLFGLLCLPAIFGGRTLAADEPKIREGTLVQYGKMHEAIGQQQSQGRVALTKLIERPHFYGVAALESLQGEATFYDGKLTITGVDAKGGLKPVDDAAEIRATLLIGAYVPSWTEHKISKDVGPDEFDQFVAEQAAQAGVKTSQPFMFVVEGEFSKLRTHVINGACPMHARLMKIELPPERRPFEAELNKIRGTIVGVFAKDAVGNLTHPATSTHAHLVYQDPASGKTVTGHVERVGLLEGSMLRLPK